MSPACTGPTILFIKVHLNQQLLNCGCCCQLSLVVVPFVVPFRGSWGRSLKLFVFAKALIIVFESSDLALAHRRGVCAKRAARAVRARSARQARAPSAHALRAPRQSTMCAASIARGAAHLRMARVGSIASGEQDGATHRWTGMIRTGRNQPNEPE